MRKFLILSLHTLMLVCAHRTSTFTDEQALLEFKSKVTQESGVALVSWSHAHLCNWTGVTCDRNHGRVVRLDLSSMKLSGAISPSIGNLSFLWSLSLAHNAFHGNIPEEVGKLSRLRYLDLSYNLLQGGVPIGLSNCSRLLVVDLTSNGLAHDVPTELGSLSTLTSLSVSKNDLTGKLPPFLGNLTSLEVLRFAYNHMDGEIPESIAKLTRMETLQLAANNFSGGFPRAIRNLSSLGFLSLGSNKFSGNLGLDLGNLLPNLRYLYLGGNHFTGTLAAPFSNVSTLRMLELGMNRFNGGIPLSLCENRYLELLGLNQNDLGRNASTDLDFLGCLANCTQLQTLDVNGNGLGGVFPVSIANLSTQITGLYFGGNFISGSIPLGIRNFVHLQSLGLENNLLTGRLPPFLGKLSGLVEIYAHTNSMSGAIPSSLGNLTTLDTLYLFNNRFDGSIPPSLGNCSYLRNLVPHSNKLNGFIPRELMQLSSLVVLDVSYNSLVGPLPQNVGNLNLLVVLYAIYNALSGHIPEALGKCFSVERLHLQGNYFDGAVPDISRLNGLRDLDLSNNSLSGNIPSYLGNFSSLQYVNLSMNNFEGAVPMTGVFQNADLVSVFGNRNLCGGIPELQLNPCSVQVMASLRRRSSVKKKITVGVGVVIASLLVTFLALVSLFWFNKKKKQNTAHNANTESNEALDPCYERVSYEELQNATDGFSSSNIIGSGNFGVVFKGFLGPENKVVAVKVLNLWKTGAAKSFMSECEALKGIRHRNLVKLLTVCCSIDFKGNEFRALVYEFMPNGSLDMWMHREDEVEAGTSNPSRTLTLLERLNIAIDVASVFVHLHAYSHNPIVHCDLKPSNILLDDDLTAHVSDFGLARLLGKFDEESSQNQLSSANIRGTIGYVAPEYGMGGEPSITGDVYSFGVLLLEIFTGKRPTDELFSEDFTLQKYARSALPDRVMDIAERSVLSDAGARMGNGAIAECLGCVLQVGIKRSEESPAKRTVIGEAVNELVSIRQRFFKAKRSARQ